MELEDVAVFDGVVPADLPSFDPVTPQAGVAKPGCKLFVDELGDVVHRLFSPDGERSGQVGRVPGHLGVDPDHAEVLEQERPDLVETMPADDRNDDGRVPPTGQLPEGGKLVALPGSRRPW